MQAPKIFVTGVTGYVGGDALFVIMAAHPTWQYSFLIRDRKRGAEFALRYPNTRVVIGDLSDTDLIKREAIDADIIMTFASSDDEPSAHAVLAGVTSDSRTRFWIHTSGTANLLHGDQDAGIALGNVNPKVWDDVEDIDAINAWPQSVLHRPVERIVLEAGAGHHNIKAAVVCPPVVMGAGRGPGNRRSIQVPVLIELIRKRRRAFQVGKGAARWGFVHVHDLSDLYLLIARAAASGGGGATWGSHGGYYFAENGEMEWGKVSEYVARRLHELGILLSGDVDSIGLGEARRLFKGLGPESVSANARNRATRARKLLNWSPRISDLEACVVEQVDLELGASQSRLQDFKQGHMPKLPASGRLKL